MMRKTKSKILVFVLFGMLLFNTDVFAQDIIDLPPDLPIKEKGHPKLQSVLHELTQLPREEEVIITFAQTRNIDVFKEKGVISIMLAAGVSRRDITLPPGAEWGAQWENWHDVRNINPDDILTFVTTQPGIEIVTLYYFQWIHDPSFAQCDVVWLIYRFDVEKLKENECWEDRAGQTHCRVDEYYWTLDWIYPNRMRLMAEFNEAGGLTIDTYKCFLRSKRLNVEGGYNNLIQATWPIIESGHLLTVADHSSTKFIRTPLPAVPSGVAPIESYQAKLFSDLSLSGEKLLTESKPGYFVSPEKEGHPKLQSALYQLTQAKDYTDFAQKHDLYIEDNKTRVVLELVNTRYNLPSEFGEEETRYANLLQALVHIDKLLELADDPNISFIRTSLPAVPLREGEEEPIKESEKEVVSKGILTYIYYLVGIGIIVILFLVYYFLKKRRI